MDPLKVTKRKKAGAAQETENTATPSRKQPPWSFHRGIWDVTQSQGDCLQFAQVLQEGDPSGCLHVLAIVNSALMNIGGDLSFIYQPHTPYCQIYIPPWISHSHSSIFQTKFFILPYELIFALYSISQLLANTSSMELKTWKSSFCSLFLPSHSHKQ